MIKQGLNYEESSVREMTEKKKKEGSPAHSNKNEKKTERKEKLEVYSSNRKMTKYAAEDDK